MPMPMLCELNSWQLGEEAEVNFLTHVSWVQRRLKGMTVRFEPGLTIVDSGLPCDTFNFVCAARLEADRAAERARAAIDYFRRVRRPFSWWIGPADEPRNLSDFLLEAGLHADEEELGMVADLDEIRPHLPPDELRIEKATTRDSLRQFAEINAVNWNPPDPHVLEFYDRATELLLHEDSPLWFYVGYLDGHPVAATELCVGGQVAGLYNVSTLAEHRRKGFGAAMVRRALDDARRAGFRVAILQASADGIGIYTRVGFREMGRYAEYKPAELGA